MKKYYSFYSIFLLFFIVSCYNKPTEPVVADIVIYNGTIYDGSGQKPYIGSIGIKDDRLVYVGKNTIFESDTTIDATDLSVSPGFINMLSWGYGTLMEDGRALSDLMQGVTLEIFGEGRSPGPYYEDGKLISFGDAMSKLEQSGESVNIASFLGAATTRILEVGYENRDATDLEMKRMKGIVKKSMEEGAMGIGSSLIYAPGDYASTNELIELSKSASEYGGMYISHLRNEGKTLLEALEELITIAREADIPAEIYHLKASREPNWYKLDEVIKRVEEVRAEGLEITADIYTYNASSTGLTGVIPTWVQEGSHNAWIERMKDPKVKITSIQYNKNHRAARDRDAKNTGISYIIGLGDYKGGKLTIFDEYEKNPVKHDIKNKFYTFDGSKYPHETCPFSGERYTLVFYSN